MNNWKTYKLGEICSQIGDGIHGTPKYCDDGSYFFINGNNFEEGRVVIKPDTKRVNEEEFHKHRVDLSDRTLLISINGTIGRTAKYKNEPCILGKSACYLNIKEEFDFNYLYFVLSSQKTVNDFVQNATGTTIKNVGLKWIREYAISLPPLPEQKRIAAILSSLDDKIENNRKINKNLEEQAQALFKSWFVDFEPFKDGEFVDSELGLIPKGWRVGKLGEICCTNKRIVKGSINRKIQYLDTGSITENHIEGLQPLDPAIDKIPSRARRLVQEGDILYSTVRPNLKHFGLLMNPEPELVVSTGFAVITANWSGFRYMIYQFLAQQEIVDKLHAIGEQSVSTYPSINASDIENLRIVIPEIEDIVPVVKVFREIYMTIHNTEQESRRLAQLRDTLLPKLMNGEIEI